MPENSSNEIIVNDKYSSLEDLIVKFGGDNLHVDLGCGYVKPPGYIGVDNLSGRGSQIPDEENAPDILMDLNGKAFPFNDNSCDTIRASHFLEHSNVPHILDECHRVLRPGGTFTFIVPYANSAEGMYPGHQIFFTEKWFHENFKFQRFFKIGSEKYDPSQYWLDLPAFVRFFIPFNFARTFLFNACWQMSIICKVKK